MTGRDKIRNEHIRKTTIIAQASKKISEKRLKKYRHVIRMKEECSPSEKNARCGHTREKK